MTTQLVTVLLSGMAGTGVRGAVSKVACGKVNYEGLPFSSHHITYVICICADLRAHTRVTWTRSDPQ